MSLRRHRKAALVGVGLLVISGAVLVECWPDPAPGYRPGEMPEGVVDATSARGRADAPDLNFVEVGAGAGLTQRHFPGRRSNLLPEDMGSGVALGDVDGDGWTDVFLPNLAGPLPGADAVAVDPRAPGEDGSSRLYRNLGDGRFEDVTAASGIELRGLANAALLVDVDGDGDLDLCVTTYPALRLWRNDGGLRFTEVTGAAGLEDLRGFWAGLGAADMDRDGDLDLYVCNYVAFDLELARGAQERSQYGRAIPAGINPSTFPPAANLLLENDGRGCFRDVAAERGVADSEARSLGVLFCDLDDDGWPDLYVANDVSDNAFFSNRGDASFEDLTAEALLGDYRGAMGLAAGDCDADGSLDIVVTHWVAQENALYRRRAPRRPDADSLAPDAPPQRAPMFVDDASRMGLGHTSLNRVGWATGFIDLDNDGRLDLFVVNGSTIPLTDDAARLEPQLSQLFWQEPEERTYFAEVGGELGEWFKTPHVGRGGAAFDLDLDGDEDLLFVCHGERPALLRNDGGNARAALRVRLRQPDGNRFALGARVAVHAGGTVQRRQVDTQGSYLSQHATGEVHFGLGLDGADGPPTARVDRLEVTWPDGVVEAVEVLPAGSLVTWERGRPPRVEPFPGRRALDLAGPTDAGEQRAFFERRGVAIQARLAGDHETAVRLYFECLAAHPGHGDVLYYLGNSLVELGREASAIWILERLVALEPESSPGWMQLGLLRLPGGDPDLDDLALAKESFERCHAINREESKPLTMLGLAAKLDGREAEALEWFEQALALDASAVDAAWFAGELHYRRGDREEARALLARARANLERGGGGASVLDEGATRGGRALVSTGGVPLAPQLVRWASLAERVLDIDVEYGGRDD